MQYEHVRFGFTDIDECENNLNNCSYMCANLNGSYYCVCDFGYSLQDDGEICHSKCHNLLGLYEYDSQLTNLIVSTGVLAGGILGMILLTFILIVAVGVCVKCVIVCRRWTNKYISDPYHNSDNKIPNHYHVLCTEMPNQNLTKLGTTTLKVNLYRYLFAIWVHRLGIKLPIVVTIL